MSKQLAPPASPDSERHLLSGMIFNEDAAGDAIRILGEHGADAFSETPHREIWRVLAALVAKGEELTLANITRNLSAETRGEALALADVAHAVADPVPYAYIVRDFYQRRQLVELCQQLTAQAQRTDANTIMRTMEDAIMGISKGAALGEPSTMAEIVPVVMEEFTRMADTSQPNRNGIMTGIHILDAKLCGLRPGLVVIAAQPKVGKTALAVNIPVNAARARVNSLIFSLEMSKEELVQRIFAIESGIDIHSMRAGFNVKHEFEKAEGHQHKIKGLPIHIDDTAALTVADIRAISRRHVTKHGAGLILIDYMQLIRSNSRYDQRHIELADTANALKNMSKELNCPVVVLAQLSAEAEACDNGYEMIKKLAGAKAILAALDVGIVLHHPKDSSNDALMRPVAITIAASRSTPIGSEVMLFDKKHQKFVRQGHDQEPPPTRSYGYAHLNDDDDFDEFARNDL